MPLRIVVVGADGRHRVALRLTELDRDEQTRVDVVSDLRPAAIALAVGPAADSTEVDVVLTAGSTAELDSATTRLWESRLAPFARNLADRRPAARTGAARLSDWDPVWQAAAERLLTRLSAVTGRLDRAPEFSWEHIGSTSAPGLAAKPIIDLQLGVPSLDRLDGLDQALLSVGFVDVAPVAPDSPGVLRDMPRGVDARQDGCWGKRLFASADPGRPAILHVRRLGSPWWRYTLRFRDLLRADPGLRRDYERVKRDLARAHSQDANYDRYTLAKTAFFDVVQDRLDRQAG